MRSKDMSVDKYAATFTHCRKITIHIVKRNMAYNGYELMRWNYGPGMIWKW